ncbi:hypothetical protein [Streptomyces sp. NPDC002825]|uniref:hypothetical protein n=1 Tax=Streptomyces sp. NPDC002825 TaxID=3154666 RepID=UPI00331B643E
MYAIREYRGRKDEPQQIPFRPHLVVEGFLTGTGLTVVNVSRAGDRNCPGRVNVTAQFRSVRPEPRDPTPAY